MWTIFKVFIEFVTILLLFYVLGFWLRGTWELSSPTRDRTRTPCIGRQSLNDWTAKEVPVRLLWILSSEALIFGHLCSSLHCPLLARTLVSWFSQNPLLWGSDHLWFLIRFFISRHRPGVIWSSWPTFIKNPVMGFPGGAVVESLPAGAGDAGLGPGRGGSHMLRSGWAPAPQLLRPARLEPVLRGGRGHRSERPMHCSREWPPLAAARESPRAAGKTQRSQK